MDEGIDKEKTTSMDGIESLIFNEDDEAGIEDVLKEFEDDANFDAEHLISVAARAEKEFEEDKEDYDIDYDSEDIDDTSPILVDQTDEFDSIDMIFPTLPEATKWIREKAKSLGIVLVKIRSRMKRNPPNVVFGCERSGPKRSHKKKVDEGSSQGSDKTKGEEGSSKHRDTLTRKCDCPFRLKCKYEKDGWFWYFELKKGAGGHNHNPFIYPEGHSYLGRLTEEEEVLAWELAQSGSRPASILQSLKKRNKQNFTEARTLYNFLAKMRRNARDGRSVVQEIFSLANNSNTYFRYTQTDGVVDNMFWSFVDNNSLAKKFPFVFIMDCTYKTNRYKLPLLHIVGVTSTMISFSAGFALLSGEKQENFEWALEMFRDSLGKTHPSVLITDRELALMKAIPLVFPDAKNLICQWHVSKAVSLFVTKKIPNGEGQEKAIEKVMEKWKEITSCKSIEAMNKVLEECKGWMDPKILEYMEKKWLKDFKELFMDMWTNEVMHLGNICTSRVEGMHSVLKKWLSSSNVDLVSHWNAATNMCQRQVSSIKASFEESLSKEVNKFRKMHWTSGLPGYISIAALQLIHKEMLRMQWVGLSEAKCRCVLRKTHGLPCAHEINLIYQSGLVYIPMDRIHSHWKTLSMVGDPCDDDGTESYLALRATGDEIWANTSGILKMHFLDRYRQAIYPSSTSLREPPVKLHNRGRPKGAKNKAKQSHEESTKRDPSAFEIAESQASEINSQPAAKNSQASENTKEDEVKKNMRKRRKKETVTWDVDPNEYALPYVPRPSTTPNINPLYLKQMPDVFTSFMISVVDVERDGNCGYRAVGVQLDMGEEVWSDIRSKLWNEIKDNYNDYKNLLLDESEAAYMKKHLLWPKINGQCPETKWMDTPNALWAVSQTFECAVSILACKKGGSLTCFPYQTPPSSDQPRHIWLMYVNNNHYLSLNMFEGCPVPPIQRGWENVATLEARRWKNLYRERLAIGTRLVRLDDPDIHNVG